MRKASQDYVATLVLRALPAFAVSLAYPVKMASRGPQGFAGILALLALQAFEALPVLA